MEKAHLPAPPTGERKIMPYFVYNVTTDKRCALVETFSGYRDARQRARDLRTQRPADADYVVKVIFAKDTEEAERLLSTEREYIPMGDD
ncbi:MAG: hypothetical protein PHF72_00335 [Gammaproteobacteria bacterium]|nr:hypothetical protein [Gammaproteobacteria bacterium]